MSFNSLFVGASILSIATYFVHLTRGYNEPLNLSVIEYYSPIHMRLWPLWLDDSLFRYCAGILILVVVFMATLSFWQEHRAIQVRKHYELTLIPNPSFIQTIQSFKKYLPVNAIVIRDAEEKEISVEELVVGDLVVIRSVSSSLLPSHSSILSAGYRIPADMRLLKAKSLRVDASEISGKREDEDQRSNWDSWGSHDSVACSAEPVASHISVFDSTNVLFKVSFVSHFVSKEFSLQNVNSGFILHRGRRSGNRIKDWQIHCKCLPPPLLTSTIFPFLRRSLEQSPKFIMIFLFQRVNYRRWETIERFHSSDSFRNFDPLPIS